MTLGGTSYGSRQRTYAVSSYKPSRAGNTGDTRSEIHELVPIQSNGANHTMITSTPDCDAESQSSQERMIRETRTWTVTETRRGSS